MKKFQCLACGKEANESKTNDYWIECSDNENCRFQWVTYDDGSSRYWYGHPFSEVECPFGCLLVVTWEEI